MSGFMFGGSALTLDIGVRNDTGGAVVAGDVVQIDLVDTVLGVQVGQDGFGAIPPPAAGTNNGWNGNPIDSGAGQFSVTGSVLAPLGLSIPNGEDMIIRVGGVAKVQVDDTVAGAGIAAGELLDISPTNDWLIDSALNGGSVDAAASFGAATRVRGTALEAVAAGGNAVISVWLRPFGGA